MPNTLFTQMYLSYYSNLALCTDDFQTHLIIICCTATFQHQLILCYIAELLKHFVLEKNTAALEYSLINILHIIFLSTSIKHFYHAEKDSCLTVNMLNS